jgi:hypothetical protein
MKWNIFIKHLHVTYARAAVTCKTMWSLPVTLMKIAYRLNSKIRLFGQENMYVCRTTNILFFSLLLQRRSQAMRLVQACL